MASPGNTGRGFFVALSAFKRCESRISQSFNHLSPLRGPKTYGQITMRLLSDEIPDRADGWQIDPGKSLIDLYPSDDVEVDRDAPVFDAKPHNPDKQRGAVSAHIKQIDPETAALIAAHIEKHGVTRVEARRENTGKVRKTILKNSAVCRAPRGQWNGPSKPPCRPWCLAWDKQRTWDDRDRDARQTLQRFKDIDLGEWHDGLIYYKPLRNAHDDWRNPGATKFLAENDREPERKQTAEIIETYLARGRNPTRSRHRLCEYCGRPIPLWRKAGARYCGEKHQTDAAAARRWSAPPDVGGDQLPIVVDWLTLRLHDLDLINGRIRSTGSDDEAISDICWRPMSQDSPIILAAGETLLEALGKDVFERALGQTCRAADLLPCHSRGYGALGRDPSQTFRIPKQQLGEVIERDRLVGGVRFFRVLRAECNSR